MGAERSQMVKRSGCQEGHSPPSNIKMKNKCSYAFSYAFTTVSALSESWNISSRFAGNNPNEFNINGSVHRSNFLIYIQQDTSLQKLYYLETALRVSGGTSTHHQEGIQLYLQHLVFVTPLLLSAA
jgi:hypothetical protein